MVLRKKITFHHVKAINAELNPICHLLGLLGAHHIFHVSRIRVKSSTHTHLLYRNQTEGLQENLEYPFNSDVIPLGTLEPSRLSSPKAYSLFTVKKISSVKCFANIRDTVISNGVAEIQYEAKKEMSDSSAKRAASPVQLNAVS